MRQQRQPPTTKAKYHARAIRAGWLALPSFARHLRYAADVLLTENIIRPPKQAVAASATHASRTRSTTADQLSSAARLNSRTVCGYHGESVRACIQRQSRPCPGSMTQQGLPIVAARWATDVSTQITRSSCAMIAAVSTDLPSPSRDALAAGRPEATGPPLPPGLFADSRTAYPARSTAAPKQRGTAANDLHRYGVVDCPSTPARFCALRAASPDASASVRRQTPQVSEGQPAESYPRSCQMQRRTQQLVQQSKLEARSRPPR